METKKQIRKRILAQRDELTPQERMEYSHAIMEFVTVSPAFTEAKQLLLFSSFGSEVDTEGIFSYGALLHKEIFFPKIQGETMNFYQVDKIQDLKPGFHDILEPDDFLIQTKQSQKFVFQPEKPVLLVMPGVCFDLKGGRIGYGKGFYDQFLQEINQEAMEKENFCKMAICFSCQLLEEEQLPRAVHDIAPDFVVTEKRIYHLQMD